MLAPKIAVARTTAGHGPDNRLATRPSALAARPFGRDAAGPGDGSAALTSHGTMADAINFNFSRIPITAPIQRKLILSSPGEASEREADDVADRVMRMTHTGAVGEAQEAIEPRCVQCKAVPENSTAAVSLQGIEGSEQESPELGDRLARSESGGESLAPGTRHDMEKAFGRDFSSVRVHRDSSAAQLSHQLSALAFTHGNHVYFGTGSYDPTGASGKRLLAHELTHVVQQGQAGLGIIARTPIPPPNRQLGAAPQLPADAQMVDLDKIEYSQLDVSFTTQEGEPLGRLAARMRKSGWDISKPADIVKMDDGRLVSLDHRRLWAAERSGVVRQVSARVHAESDPIPDATASRLTIQKGRVPAGANPATGAPWKVGDKPSTWGDAVRFRSAGQVFQKAGKQSNVGIDPTALPGGGVRDPAFPRSGSKDLPMRVQPGPLEERIDPTAGGSVIKSGGQRKNVPTGKTVSGTIEGGTFGSGPPRGGGAGGPTVETSIPGTTTTARSRARTTSSSAPHGGGDFDEGGSVDITSEEEQAMHGGPSGPSLLEMLGQWLVKDIKQRQIDEIMKISLQEIDQQIPKRLQALEYMTMALQYSGEIAYAQITVRRTTTSEAVVFDLESVAVSGWYRQASKDDSPLAAGGDIRERVETNSFALPLLPSVRTIYAQRLQSALATADAQSRPKLQDCLHRLETKGPQVPAFSFLGGSCLDVLPQGAPPP